MNTKYVKTGWKTNKMLVDGLESANNINKQRSLQSVMIWISLFNKLSGGVVPSGFSCRTCQILPQLLCNIKPFKQGLFRLVSSAMGVYITNSDMIQASYVAWNYFMPTNIVT